ncbi:hypothetical protein C8A05DRAFT_11937 [Staphylotrichum tortipilum]|uniref:Uncharacterized protein n=1 Tax=Staphylotrichum tortipilum TaxID=2831512 RepID=A0AAN6MSL3_9PEZI|nr:hypothetical protein C8A05DRAFT_11937 [Staphylotrichum longicolle]
MYSTPYGYPNAAARPIFNGGAPPPQGAHLQPAPSPNQAQQQMMYNAQQFPMPGAGQPGPFPPGSNPALMGAPGGGPGGGGAGGPATMMQNAAMPPHMAAANGQMAFQNPYTTSPYANAIPSSAGPQPQLSANFMMPGQMGPYMNAGMPGQQQPMMQRMMPQQNPAGMSVSTPQRQFNPPQGTPTSQMPPQQPQFSTPQTQSTPQSQTPTTAQHLPPSAATPQTPTFPTDQTQPQLNGTSTGSTPQSPATESRDKERMAVLLEINQELLYESIQLVNSRNELKKEQAIPEARNPDIDYAEEEKLANLDYNQCMRRLQTNLSYMFALADRKGKAQIPPSPAYLTTPPLNLQLKLKLPPSAPDDPVERPADPVADRAERDQLLKTLYRKLQSLYPGVDPKKEPPAQPPAGAAAAGAAGRPGGGVGGKGVPNGQGPVSVMQGGSNQNSPAPTPGQSAGTPLMGNAAVPGL